MSIYAQPTRDPGVIITHPNRSKAAVQATRATVVLLLLASAGLVLIITVGGWKVLWGAKPIEIGFVVVYLTLAFYAMRWNRGVLPISAVLAVLLLIFALVAGPSWFARDKTGFTQPAINAGVLGTLTLLVVPLQILLIAFSMRGFRQGWNVELEQREPGAEMYGDPPPGADLYGDPPPGADLYGDPPPHPA
jgi:hypothetical protein